MARDPVEVVRAVVDCDNGRDKAGYRGLLFDDYQAEVFGRLSSRSGDEEADALERYWQAFPDGRIVEEEISADEGVVTLRYRLVGTNTGAMEGRPATGRQVDVAGCTILVVEDGRVRRTHRYVDTLGMMQQLGVLPTGG